MSYKNVYPLNVTVHSLMVRIRGLRPRGSGSIPLGPAFFLIQIQDCRLENHVQLEYIGV